MSILLSVRNILANYRVDFSCEETINSSIMFKKVEQNFAIFQEIKLSNTLIRSILFYFPKVSYH